MKYREIQQLASTRRLQPGDKVEVDGQRATQMCLKPGGQRPPVAVYSLYSLSRTCGYCDADISLKRPQALFCSNAHRAAFRNERLRQTRSPLVVGADAADDHQRTNHHPTANKLQRVLAALADGATLNRLEAERELGDHVLPSTISAIEHRLGVHVSRRRENRCALYWLNDEQRVRAAELLAGRARSGNG